MKAQNIKTAEIIWVKSLKVNKKIPGSTILTNCPIVLQDDSIISFPIFYYLSI